MNLAIFCLMKPCYGVKSPVTSTQCAKADGLKADGAKASTTGAKPC